MEQLEVGARDPRFGMGRLSPAPFFSLLTTHLIRRWIK